MTLHTFPIRFPDGSEVEATVRGDGCPKLDAVLLDLSPPLVPALRCLGLAPLTTALGGTRVRIRGFPLDRDFEFSAVVAAEIVESDVAINDGVLSLQLLSHAVGYGQNLTGYSGAPVLIEDDVCIGMVVLGRPSHDPHQDVHAGTFYAARVADLVTAWPGARRTRRRGKDSSGVGIDATRMRPP